MPHDKKGTKLSKGDLVTLSAKVENVSEGEDACNVTLQLVGDDSYLPQISCNSKLCEKTEELAGCQIETTKAAKKGFDTLHTDKDRYPK